MIRRNTIGQLFVLSFKSNSAKAKRQKLHKNFLAAKIVRYPCNYKYQDKLFHKNVDRPNRCPIF